MKITVRSSCLLLLWGTLLHFCHGENSNSVDLFKDISQILNQLRGRTTSDQLRVFNFIRNNVNFIQNRSKQRSNNRFSSTFPIVKSYRKSDHDVDLRIDLKVQLKSSCRRDKDCGSKQGLKCLRGKCQCNVNHVQVNETHCLPGALLGFRCEDHAQCDTRVKSSSCIQGFCRCGEGFVPYRRANCLKGSLLNEKCRTHFQCQMMTQGSSCKWIVRNVLGKCSCTTRNPRRGDKCGPPGFALGAPCGRSYDCFKHVPGSICVDQFDPKNVRNSAKNRKKGTRTKSYREQYTQIKLTNSSLSGTCQCPRGYLDIEKGSRCVPVSKEIGVSPVSLGMKCLYVSQCIAADPFSICQNGICTCANTSSTCSADNRGCFNGTFQCITSGRCISPEFVCNGIRDCSDGSDELECVPGRCSTMAFTCNDGSCITRGLLCDGQVDCPDGSDESGCFKSKTCLASTFRCKNGDCLPGHSFCNANIDCRDGSDEDKMTCIGGKLRINYCPFRCKNSRCRSIGVVCSGQDGCGDNSDEEKCTVCSCPKP